MTAAAPALSFDSASGAARLEGVTMSIGASAAKADIEAAFAARLRSSRDLGNGYEWLHLDGFAFAGEPCRLSVCFRDGRVVELTFGLSAADASETRAWPSREAVDREIAFVRHELARQLGRPFASGIETFSWGQIGAVRDDKAGGLPRAFAKYAD